MADEPEDSADTKISWFGLTQYNVLTSNPLIVERIFTFLPMKDLNRMSVVCQLWADMTRRVKARRQQISWLFWLMPKTNASKKEMLSALENYLKDKLNCISSEPSLAIAFASTTMSEVKLHLVDMYNFKTHLPQSCQLLMSWNPGIIEPTLAGNMNERYEETEWKHGCSCLLLPKISGVETKLFEVKLPFHEYSTFIPSVEQILNEAPPKALLLFTNIDSQKHGVSLAINAIVNKWGHGFALGGGLVFSLLLPNGEPSPPKKNLVGIAFYGERVKAASIVIKASGNEHEVFDRSVRRLKRQGFPEDCTFAFMFSCIGRGNVETDAFHSTFPQTPLFGFFGLREIGMNSSSVSSSESGDKFEAIHIFTTVFVLVSIC